MARGLVEGQTVEFSEDIRQNALVMVSGAGPRRRPARGGADRPARAGRDPAAERRGPRHQPSASGSDPSTGAGDRHRRARPADRPGRLVFVLGRPAVVAAAGQGHLVRAQYSYSDRPLRLSLQCPRELKFPPRPVWGQTCCPRKAIPVHCPACSRLPCRSRTRHRHRDSVPPRSRSRPPGGAAVRHRRAARAGAPCSPSPHRPRGRGPAGRAAAACCRPTRSRSTRAGRRCRTSGSRPRADTVGRRLAVLRRLAHPSADDPATGPLSAWSSPRCARVLQPQVPGLGDLEPVELRAGRRRTRARRHRHRPGRRRLRPRRPGREARRVRRARRHPRRLPADRGAPAAGGVLGRRGRGDPLLQGRRPALARGRAARAVGAAVPRAAAHRRGAGRGRRALLGRAPGAGRAARADQPRQCRRGHGVARARCSSTSCS